MQKKHRNITGQKFWPTVSKKRKLREVVRKRGKVPLYPYFHPYGSKLWECFLPQWVFALKFKLYGENVVQQVRNFDSRSTRKGNWERLWGREERFPVPIFPPTSFEIVKLLIGWMGFYSEVSSILEERGWWFFSWRKTLVLSLGCCFQSKMSSSCFESDCGIYIEFGRCSKWLVFGQ